MYAQRLSKLNAVLAAALAPCLAYGQPAATSAPKSNGSTPTGIDLKPSEQCVTETVVCCPDDEWDIDAPVRLEAANPTGPCQIQIFNELDYSTASDGTDDDIDHIFRVEWGFAKNHELNLKVPVRMGDGGYDGNADITVGWQWRLWEEQELLPAFALLNQLRIPNGYQSEGVDWTLTGLMTKSLIPDKLRLHVNPFLKTVNGENLRDQQLKELGSRAGWYTWDWDDNDELDPRHFQWGVISGIDYKINECLILVADYIHEASSFYGWRNQHTAELGLEWRLAENQMIGTSTYCTLDGDSLGPNWGMRFNYAYTFDYGN